VTAFPGQKAQTAVFAVNSMSAMRVLVLAGNALAMTHWQGLAAVEAAGENLASYATGRC